MVAHTFFYWIDHYYAALEPYIAERQVRDPLVWADLQPFVERLRSEQAKRVGRPLPALTQQQVADFLMEEQIEGQAG